MKVRFVSIILIFSILTLLGCGRLSGLSKDYYPLKEGMTWEYQISEGSAGQRNKGVKFSVTNLAARDLKGRKVFPRKTEGEGRTQYSFFVNDGDGVYQFAAQSPGDVEPNIYEKPGYLIKYPIEVGHSWESRLLVQGVEFTTQSKIESTDEVITVPAGNFECLRIKSVGSASKGHGQVSTESYSWYAQGVGLVKSIIKVKVTSGGIFPQQKHEEITMELSVFRKE